MSVEVSFIGKVIQVKGKTYESLNGNKTKKMSIIINKQKNCHLDRSKSDSRAVVLIGNRAFKIKMILLNFFPSICCL